MLPIHELSFKVSQQELGTLVRSGLLFQRMTMIDRWLDVQSKRRAVKEAKWQQKLDLWEQIYGELRRPLVELAIEIRHQAWKDPMAYERANELLTQLANLIEMP